MEFHKTRLWKTITIIYWTLIFLTAAFGYWLVATTLF